jgi:hypothetical protein
LAEGARHESTAPPTRQHVDQVRGSEHGLKKVEAQMNESDFDSRDRSQKREAHGNFEDKIQYLLRGEEQLLQSISAGTPLREVLDRICSAIDLQIGDIYSLISLPHDDATDYAAIARVAARFSLHTFCSASVVAENEELLGSLEMYSCVPRSPSTSEFQLIERVTCLAAIAIKRHNEACNDHSFCIHEDRPVRGYVFEWPVCMN